MTSDPVGRRLSRDQSLPGLFFLFFVTLLFFLGQGAYAQEPDLAARLTRLAKEYEAQISLASNEQALGIYLNQSARTWYETAGHLAARFNNRQAQIFLKKSLEQHHRNTAVRLDNQKVMQLSGLNLLFQAVDTTAFLLAQANQDQKALVNIKMIENSARQVAAKKEEGTTMAALSGAVMALLAVCADQVDQQHKMTDILKKELDLRQDVDRNISQLKDITPQHRTLLLINNHFFGCLSMIQIIGLVLDPTLKSNLGNIEKKLRKVKEADLELQILGGAEAMTEAGFLTAGSLTGFQPGSPSPK